MKTPDALRKRAQRQRDAENGITELRVRLEPDEAAMLSANAAGRRLLRTPYAHAEYIALLIREDHYRLNKQLALIQKQTCKKCGDTAPGEPSGCVCIGDSDCWQTHGWRKLLLNKNSV